MTNLMVVETMGREICVIDNMLSYYMCKTEYQKLTTRAEKNYLPKASKCISNYKSLSESYFFKNDTIDSINIFYGLRIKRPPFVKGDVCAMCNKSIPEDTVSERFSNFHLAENMGRDIQLIKRELERFINNPENVRLMDSDITDITGQLVKAIGYIDNYIAKTEIRLIKNNVILDNDIFYNLDEEIENGNFVDICLLCHQEK